MGTVVFAITGLLAASRHQLDLFGAIVLAMVTAVGGGTLRDLILNVPVFWLAHTEYVYLIVVTTIAVAIYRRTHIIPVSVLLVLDAIGLAVFSIIGAEKALALGYSDVIAVMMGVMTGVVGGMVRDICYNNAESYFGFELPETNSQTAQKLTFAQNGNH
jgi:uncharacterized membrane protein YeiH